ncbi:MAG: hypothetical protein A2W91_16320 [Bacteroidetes bacterium GWF2_38_335]|nr:MAG: hypothetical protein A2W91_16320 [Bacteroidetes bacterium GWF2_38_335]OFY81255.1 MAG: hypothetical protein A2281_07295 [Bacteroidetes bacterium RIFOXYA12_FULL_38_20]HBS85372.1 hypothetical protein [Bacteroidales bacterium]
MDINRKNYELYFMDYLDGNLNELQIAVLMAFLVENPDLEQELNDLRNLDLEIPTVEFTGKQNLKKFDFTAEISSSNFNDFAVAYHENDLNQIQKQKTELFLKKNPQYNKDFELFAAVRLKPDFSIVYKDKSKLKQRKTVLFDFRKPAVYLSVAVAAAVLIFMITSVIPAFINNETNTAKSISGAHEITLPEIIIKNNGNAVPQVKEQFAEKTNNNIFRVNKKKVYIDNNPVNDSSDLIVPHFAEEKIKKDTFRIVLPENNNIAEEKIIPEIVKNDSVTDLRNENKDLIAENKTGRSKKFSLWKTIETGVNTVSGLAGGKKVIDNEYNEDGSVKKVEINTRLFAYKSN